MWTSTAPRLHKIIKKKNPSHLKYETFGNDRATMAESTSRIKYPPWKNETHTFCNNFLYSKHPLKFNVNFHSSTATESSRQ